MSSKPEYVGTKLLESPDNRNVNYVEINDAGKGKQRKTKVYTLLTMAL